MVEHPFIYEINTWVWLGELGAPDGRERRPRRACPAEEWDAIAALGFDAVWLMGVWERSPAGIAIALAERRRSWRASGARCRISRRRTWSARRTASATTRSRRELGGPDGLAAARDGARRARPRLILDFVPNHVAPDHPWTAAHPEYFVRGSEDDLERDPASFVRVGDRVLANGRDPYFPAWPDVVQLNAFSPDLRGCGDRHARLDRRAVRRRPLRHGDAR